MHACVVGGFQSLRIAGGREEMGYGGVEWRGKVGNGVLYVFMVLVVEWR